MEVLLATANEYFINSSFHGLRYVVESGRHNAERIFWIVCCLLSWYGSILLMQASWDNFKNNAVSFAMESSYLDWNTTFPAVHVCEIAGENQTESMGGIEDFDLAEIYKEIAFFKGEATFTIDTCFEDNDNPDGDCPNEDLLSITLQRRTPCHKVFLSCSWNGKPLNCCGQFLPLQTEIGMCYSINSIQTRHDLMGINHPMLVSSHATGPGTLAFDLAVPSEVYLLTPQEVPMMSTSFRYHSTVTMGTSLQRWVSVVEVENDQGVRHMTQSQRKCRFHDEGGLHVYREYSYSGCVVQCRKEAQLRMCNCCSHVTPNAAKEEMCDLKGLACLSRNYNYLSILRHRFSKRNHLFCPCPLSCDEQIMNINHETTDSIHDHSKSTVVIKMTEVPKERCKRYVVRSVLDLVVSMGATTALFVGASLLSFVEFLYYFTLRLYCYFRCRGTKKELPLVERKISRTRCTTNGQIPRNVY